MKIERAAQRFVAIFGWQPVGILCVVLLVSVMAVDHFVAEYGTLSDKSASLEKKSGDMKRKIGQQKQLETVLKEKQELLAARQEKGYFGITPELAGPLLLTDLQNLATATHVKAPFGNVLPPSAEQGSTLLKAEVEFSALTQQLVAFLENAANSPKLMRIDMLDINVQDAELPAMLVVKLAAQSFYVAPRKVEKSAGALPTGGTK
jgi:hypothetical protein